MTKKDKRKKCPYCKKRPLLDRHNAQTCGNNACSKKRNEQYQVDYQLKNKDRLRKAKRDKYHEKKKESKTD